MLLQWAPAPIVERKKAMKNNALTLLLALAAAISAPAMAVAEYPLV